MTLGQKGKPGDATDQFNKPTDVAIARQAEFYVSDGYGNSRVVKFSREEVPQGMGKKGPGEGEFNTPHAILLDDRGRVIVGDREQPHPGLRRRRQVSGAWKESGAPFGLFLTADKRLFVADGRAHWVKVLDLEGKPLGRWGEKGRRAGTVQPAARRLRGLEERSTSPRSMDRGFRSSCRG
jgi:hypothetical protein